jgi:hypothetical protein
MHHRRAIRSPAFAATLSPSPGSHQKADHLDWSQFKWRATHTRNVVVASVLARQRCSGGTISSRASPLSFPSRFLRELSLSVSGNFVIWP